MELSILVARIAAITYLAVSLALFRGELKGEELVESFERSTGLRLITGIFALILGALLIQYHNFWVMNWTVLVTVIGWASVVKGVLYIAIPRGMFKFTKRMMINEKSWGVVSLFIGLLFGYFGFVA